MTINKAIKTLERMLEQGVFYVDPDAVDALTLGLEALKQIAELRQFGLHSAAPRLPGETEK